MSQAVLVSRSVAGGRAVEALSLALERLGDADRRAVPRQRRGETTRLGRGEPHLHVSRDVPPTPASMRAAATFVAENMCTGHAPTAYGRVLLLTQELLVQTVGRSGLAATVVLTCDGDGLTVSVDLAAVDGVEPGPGGAPDLAAVQQIADEWGAEPLRPGVRYWAAVNGSRPDGSGDGPGGEAGDGPAR